MRSVRLMGRSSLGKATVGRWRGCAQIPSFSHIDGMTFYTWRRLSLHPCGNGDSFVPWRTNQRRQERKSPKERGKPFYSLRHSGGKPLLRGLRRSCFLIRGDRCCPTTLFH